MSEPVDRVCVGSRLTGVRCLQEIGFPTLLDGTKLLRHNGSVKLLCLPRIVAHLVGHVDAATDVIGNGQRHLSGVEGVDRNRLVFSEITEHNITERGDVQRVAVLEIRHVAVDTFREELVLQGIQYHVRIDFGTAQRRRIVSGITRHWVLLLYLFA